MGLTVPWAVVADQPCRRLALGAPLLHSLRALNPAAHTALGRAVAARGSLCAVSGVPLGWCRVLLRVSGIGRVSAAYLIVFICRTGWAAAAGLASGAVYLACIWRTVRWYLAVPVRYAAALPAETVTETASTAELWVETVTCRRKP